MSRPFSCGLTIKSVMFLSSLARGGSDQRAVSFHLLVGIRSAQGSLNDADRAIVGIRDVPSIVNRGLEFPRSWRMLPLVNYRHPLAPFLIRITRDVRLTVQASTAAG